MLELPGVGPCPVPAEMLWVRDAEPPGRGWRGDGEGRWDSSSSAARGAETCWLLVTLQGITVGPALGAVTGRGAAAPHRGMEAEERWG